MFRWLAVKRRLVVTLLLVAHLFLAKYPPMDIRNSLVHSSTGAGSRSNALNDVCGVCTHYVEVSGGKRWQWLGSSEFTEVQRVDQMSVFVFVEIYFQHIRCSYISSHVVLVLHCSR